MTEKLLTWTFNFEANNMLIHHENMSVQHPLEPHFYIAKLGYAGEYLFFLFFAPKHRLWVLVGNFFFECYKVNSIASSLEIEMIAFIN